MRFETVTRALRDLVRDFHQGAILLPQFQRDYVWKPTKIRNLLDSLLRGFPIGGFYLWRPASGATDPKSTLLGQQIKSQFVGYLIDGQQRLTSLEAAYALYTGDDKRGAELRCYLDLAAKDLERVRDTRLFVTYAGHRSVKRRVEGGDSTLVPISQLFHGDNHDLRRSTEDALRLIPGWEAKRVQAALARFDRACRMLDQVVPCTTVFDVSDSDAVEVFSRLNKGGSPLRQSDVSAAELARGHAVDVLKSMREFVTGERPVRMGFGFSFAFRALVVFHRESARFSTLRPDWMETAGPHKRSLRQSWKAAQEALDAALCFLDERMGWSRKALLPSANAAIVLAAAFDRGKAPIGSEAEQVYRRWLCLCALRGVFQGSVETTLDRFCKAVRSSGGDPARALVRALKRDEASRISAEELNLYSHPWGAPTQVLHAWLVSQGASDWLTDDKLDLLARSGNPTLPGGELTVHHIFPRKLLAGLGFDPDEANSVSNYALLSRATNSEFGDKPPSDVHGLLSTEQRAAAAPQWFGEAAGDRLNSDQYDEFCEWRAARLAIALNDWLGLARK